MLNFLSYIRNLFNCLQPHEHLVIVNPGFKNQEFIYNFMENSQEYVNKCKPIIEHMCKTNLIQDFGNLSMHDDNIFLDKFRKQHSLVNADFSNRDLAHVIYTQPLICSILTMDYNMISFKLNSDMNMVAKLVMKKYLVNPKPTFQKISVRVFITGITIVNNSPIAKMQELKVVCYNNTQDDDGVNYLFRSPKGSVEQNETVENAVIREMKEELGFTFDIIRYKYQKILSSKPQTWFNYTLNITDIEWQNYLTTLNTLNLDPEITHIILESV